MKVKPNTWYKLPAGSEYRDFQMGIMRIWRDVNPKKTSEDMIVKTKNWSLRGDGDIIGLTCDMYVQARLLEAYPLKPVSKAIRDQLTPKSVWKLTEDYKDYRYGIDEDHLFLPKDTEFQITGKAKINFDGEKYYPVSFNDCKEWLNVRFFGNIIENVQAGKVKTYWKLVDRNGNPLTSKRFETLARVKSSVTIRTQVLSKDQLEEFVESGAGEYLAGGASERFDDWKAIHYDLQNNVIETVELRDWFLMKVLKT